MDQPMLLQAAKTIKNSEALLITAGAGMGVDSGLPDFRGQEGFWRAYPPLKQLGVSFEQMAHPRWFQEDPELAWGFYGHRLHLYRATSPHRGFEILREIGKTMPVQPFIFTSNVDGQFQKAGFSEEAIVECHGSIHHLQCSRPCTDMIWKADTLNVDVDMSNLRAKSPLPRCPYCGRIARQNILMFGDAAWLSSRNEEQEQSFERWLRHVDGLSVVIIECGAGISIPTVRRMSEYQSRTLHAPLIRINVQEAQGPEGTLSVATGALSALETLSKAMSCL